MLDMSMPSKRGWRTLCTLTALLALALAQNSGVVEAGVGGMPLPAAGKAPIRAIHISLEPGAIADEQVSPVLAKKLILRARENGFNTLVILLSNQVRLNSNPTPVKDSRAWSREDFLDVAGFARNQGLEIVPEIKLLTHQEKLLKKHRPDLLFNDFTYDPRKESVYQLIFPVLDELIELIHPRAIHIGHDEVAGWVWKRKSLPDLRVGNLPDEQPMLPAELYLQDILKLHGYLKAKGVETWMWGDMLISPAEFPDMLDRDLHGTVEGYGKPLRDKLPRDIVICDWHYSDDQSDFPSMDVMQKEGFRVIGSIWKKEKTTRNFSRYAARHGAMGMMATTWFHVRKNEWGVVDSIIDVSGTAFLKDFPDAK
jgi:hypothetical protein